MLGSRAAGKSVLSASVLNAGGVVISDDLLLVGSLGEKILGERMREFISLRSSWASDHLLDDLETEWSNSRTGNRAFLRVSAADSRFRNYSKIDRIWLLSRPRLGRSEKSSICATTHAETYTALVAATQPLLLDSDFVVEKAQLHSLFLKIISSTSAVRIETGQDIVVSPEKTWRRLLAASPH